MTPKYVNTPSISLFTRWDPSTIFSSWVQYLTNFIKEATLVEGTNRAYHTMTTKRMGLRCGIVDRQLREKWARTLPSAPLNPFMQPPAYIGNIGCI